MEDLIKALQIFLKYGNPKYPTYCQHDELRIMEIHIDNVLEDDIKSLNDFGFFWCDVEECFKSFKYGSA